MELRDYLAIIGRRMLLFLSVIILVTAGFIVYAAGKPTTFEAVASMSVVKDAQAGTTAGADYRYDTYYTLEATALLAEVVSGWLAEPNVVAEIYNKAGVAVPAGDVTRLGNQITTKLLTGASVSVVTEGATADEAAKLAENATGFVQERISQLETDGNFGAIHLFATAPISQAQTSSVLVTGIVGFLVGLVLALILVYFVEYLKPSKR